MNILSRTVLGSIKGVSNIVSSKNGLSVMVYHRVTDLLCARYQNELTYDRLKEQFSWLARNFNVIPLSEAISLLEQGNLPKNSVVITVDDGYIDSYTHIFPTLKELDLSATFFISTSGLEKGYLWDHIISEVVYGADTQLSGVTLFNKNFDLSTFKSRINTVAEITQFLKYKSLEVREVLISELLNKFDKPKIQRQFCTAEQLIEMKNNGMEIGAHTHHHPILAVESDHIAREELKKSKDILESILKCPVDFNAYPNGKFDRDFNEKHLNMVKDLGFKASFSSNWGGVVDINEQRYALPRFTPWDSSELKFCTRLILNALK